NGVGASFLLLLTLSGLVLWWPGIRNWKRGLGIKLNASWKRINYDLHSAIGFWTLLIVSIWSVSSINFAWPQQVGKLVNRVSSVASLQAPAVPVSPPAKGQKLLPLGQLIALGDSASPNAIFYGVFLPRAPRTPLTVLMARGEPGNFYKMDYVLVDPYRGKTVAVWHRGINPTLGSKFLAMLGPLHFGTQWGIAVKIIWFLLGISLAVLSITGPIMYWNRILAKKWKLLCQMASTAK
ncbi:MAG: PepSY-associated TM helix domain-containing protein, partial [Terriglobus sp.]